MRHLPSDHLRCQPKKVDAKCKNCKRWCGQDPSPAHSLTISAAVNTSGSRDRACIHVAISRLQ